MDAASETVVTFGSGRETLMGILHPAQGGERDLAVLVLVGGPQYRVGSHRMFVHIARRLAAFGFPVLRFDFAGMGDSSGSFRGFEKLDADVKAALDAFSSRCTATRFALLGLCDGATAASFYASTDPRVAGLALLNPWVHTIAGEAKAFLWHYYPRRVLQRDFWQKLTQGKVELRASIRDFTRKVARALTRRRTPGSSEQKLSFVERMRIALERFSGPIIVVTSGNDLTAAEFLALWNGDERWSAIRSAATHVGLPEADHTLSAADDMSRYLDAVGQWLSAHSAERRLVAAAGM